LILRCISRNVFVELVAFAVVESTSVLVDIDIWVASEVDCYTTVCSIVGATWSKD
jgi:hypothetical protein